MTTTTIPIAEARLIYSSTRDNVGPWEKQAAGMFGITWQEEETAPAGIDRAYSKRYLCIEVQGDEALLHEDTVLRFVDGCVDFPAAR